MVEPRGGGRRDGRLVRPRALLVREVEDGSWGCGGGVRLGGGGVQVVVKGWSIRMDLLSPRRRARHSATHCLLAVGEPVMKTRGAAEWIGGVARPVAIASILVAVAV